MAAKESKIAKASELCEDLEFRKSVQEFETRINTLGGVIKSCCESGMYANLTMEEKVRYDLFLSYSLTSLYWVYLRTQGEDPASHIKSELERVKTYIDRSKQIQDRKTMPRLDKSAAKRFVKSGLWEPKKSLEPAECVKTPLFSRKRKHTTFQQDD